MKRPKKIAILGYGSQGRAWALNLRDSGLDIMIGLPPGSPSRRVAVRDKFRPVNVSEAVRLAEVIIFAFPDHLHGRVFQKNIKSDFQSGSTLVFLHGLSIHFRLILPPPDCDILLLAPLAPGVIVREKYLKREAVGYFHAVYRNNSGEANKILQSLIRAMRIDKKELIRTTFAEEAIGDIFGEQAVLCGGLPHLILAGYETLTKAGLSSDKAYLEVCYQLDLIIDLIKRFGIEGMYRRISATARYGSIQAGPEIIDRHVENRLKGILKDIKSGRFAAFLSRLDEKKMRQLDTLMKRRMRPDFEKSARKFSPERKKKK